MRAIELFFASLPFSSDFYSRIPKPDHSIS